MEVSPLAKILVTAALPYANARLHLGHLRSTYIPADIYARYLRLRGCEVIYVCATDEHGAPITVRAEEEGVSPKSVVDKYHKLAYEDLTKVGCAFDIFSRTTLPIHYELTQEFFIQLQRKGYIYDAEYEQPYCVQCKRFLPDRYVEGVCPHCGYEGARGDECDVCSRYLKPTDLKNPRCVLCGSTPQIRKTRHWFFKLSAFQQFLEDWLRKNERLPENVKNYALQWLQEGLRDWCISRDLTWGVPVPVRGAEGKVLYVWFDAPIGYISSTKTWAINKKKAEQWKTYWQGKKAQLIHFIGKGIIYHHAIFWPAMLKAHGKFNLPTTIIAGGHYTLEGRKMSKSRGWVVEVSDYLKAFDPDLLRYYLTAVAPLAKDADFSWEDFAKRCNDELADILGNFIHRTLTFTCQYFQCSIPKPGRLARYDRQILNSIKHTQKETAEQIEQFNFHLALKAILDLASKGNKYLNDKKPWATIKSEPNKAATAIYVSDQIVKALATLIEPFLPYTAEKLWITLNLKGDVHKQTWDEALKKIPAGHRINKPRPLYPKIEDEIIRKQKEALQKALETAPKPNSPTISINEFSRLDLRIGTIVTAESVPGSSKLIKLRIDLGGGDVKEAVAGIRPWYEPRNLEGKQIAVLTNIKPTRMFGVESQVMILAAEDEKTVAILQPDKPVKTGSKIR